MFKAIHLIRNPFDNIVSRFNFEQKHQNYTYANPHTKGVTKSRTGFRTFCRRMDDMWLNSERQHITYTANEELGLLSLAGNNQQLLVNLVAPLLVEGAPLLLPVVAGALGAGPGAFYLGAAAFGGLEAFLLATDAELPLVGLPAGAVLGLLLVPLTGVSAGAGYVLSQAKK